MQTSLSSQNTCKVLCFSVFRQSLNAELLMLMLDHCRETVEKDLCCHVEDV